MERSKKANGMLKYGFDVCSWKLFLVTYILATGEHDSSMSSGIH
jgi:hypothetical protein